MEVILKENVAKLGRRGEVVKVADGYGRNYLLPRKLAIEANASNLKNLNQMQAAAKRREQQEQADAQALASRLNQVSLSFQRRAGERETLFGSVTSMDILHELQQKGFEIERRQIELPDPLKSLGQFKVPVHLFHGVTAHISVEVQKEGEPQAEAAQ